MDSSRENWAIRPKPTKAVILGDLPVEYLNIGPDQPQLNELKMAEMLILSFYSLVDLY